MIKKEKKDCAELQAHLAELAAYTYAQKAQWYLWSWAPHAEKRDS